VGEVARRFTLRRFYYPEFVYTLRNDSLAALHWGDLPMSVALTDVLIELAKPTSRAAYERDPETFLNGRGLTDEEINAVREANVGAIRFYARSSASLDPTQQFNRYVKNNDILIEIEPMVEQHMEHHDQIAVHDLGPTAVDETGRLFRIVPNEK